MMFQRPRLAARQSTLEGMQGNAEVGICMAIDAERAANADLDAKLFANLAPQTTN
jgi:hypothetical protein